MGRRHCNTCELPQIICACAEAKAYDKANPLTPAQMGFDEEPGTSIGKDGLKKSHRGEGSNFVD